MHSWHVVSSLAAHDPVGVGNSCRFCPSTSSSKGRQLWYVACTVLLRGLAMAQSKVRYAVVGLGYIAQAAVLPSFAHARRNSSLHAIVSGSIEKLNELGDKYRVPVRASYDEYERVPAGSRCRLHLHAQLRARRLRGARRQGRQARAVREAARGDAGGVPPHDQGRQAGRRQAHDRVSAALRAAVSRSARHRALRQDRRAALLQLVVLDAREAGRHPHASASSAAARSTTSASTASTPRG